MTDTFSQDDLFVSPQGNDKWSGTLPAPNAEAADGPLSTIERARDVVRERKLGGGLRGPMTVWIRGGRYAIAEPIVFGPEDSAPVTYAAYPEEQPILDGGVRLQGWQATEIEGREVWTVDLPQVAKGKWTFRQLFVDGVRRPRTRLPRDGYYWMADVPGTGFDAELFDGTDTFQCAPGDIQEWKNLGDVDVVVLHKWIEERMPIASFDPETGTVVSSRRSMFALKADIRGRYAKYYVENVLEALGEPGEWYLDQAQGKFYYVPMPGEKMDQIEAYAPVTEYLLQLIGRPDENEYVEFLRFEGLTFEHSAWHQPAGGGERFRRPGIDFAAAPQAALNIPGAVRLEGARYCAIEDCMLRHIGWYGIELTDGCRGNRIVGNAIHDLGAGGVKLDGSDARGAVARRTGDNRVTDNHVYDGGHVFCSAVGILSVHSFGNQLSHNHIHDFYYTGISCGWVWGYAENVSKNNLIEKNHIHHLGHKLLSDMGGIYTLGVQPGTVIRGNLIHDIEKWNYGGWAIYPDEGSSHILIENNLCYDTSSQPFHQHYGRGNVVRNNIFAFGREGQVALGRAEAHTSFFLERNIIVTDGQPLFVGGYSGQLEKRKSESDLNLFWDVSGEAVHSGNSRGDGKGGIVLVRTFDLDAWREMGYDQHSIVADPGFKNLANRDFTLGEDSPALDIGFRPIDLSDVGPRPKDQR